MIRVNDIVSGLVAAAIGGAIYATAGTFPEIPGEPGPSLFPRAAAVGLMLCGIALMVHGLRDSGRGTWAEWPDWIGDPRRLLSVLVIVIGLAVCAGFMEALGYFVCAPVMLIVLMLAIRVRTVVAIPVSIGATLLVHAIFYSGLRVALPWGLLEAWAW